MSWFKDWFNSPYYHLLYQHRSEAEAETFIARLLDFLKPHPNARLLDLACGKGRHARFMARKGYHVTGIDLASESIALAQNSAHERLQFEVGDMRNIGKEKAFDYVFNFFTSFGYFDQTADNLLVLRSVHQALVPNGYLLIDFLNVPFAENHLRTHETQIINGISFAIERHKTANHFVKKITITDKEQQLYFSEKVQAITLAEFETYLAAENFALEQVWGNYQLAPYEAQTSDRLIMLARAV